MVQRVPQSGISGISSFKNMITNGDMQISQRGTSFASMGNGDTQYTLDRFGWYEEGDHGAAEITITQDTDVPTGQGFSKSLKAVCATVDTSIDAGTIAYVSQKFEGQFLQHLAKGTSSAKSTTLSFWCKSNLTGTFTISVHDQDNTRMFSTSYSPASANTWEKFIINIPADTTGALDNDNASSYRINWNLQAGTNKSNGALASAWEAQAEGDRAVGQTNFYSSTDNNWYITGVQWEVGDAATDFEHLPHDVQLTRCCRYYWKPVQGNASTSEYVGLGDFYSSTQVDTDFRHITPMRTQPTLDQGTGTDYFIYYYGQTASGTVDGSWTYWIGNEHISSIYAAASDAVGTSNAGKACRIIATTTGGTSVYLALNAEL
tara:strand:+ start:72 stop:1196 length:1125 start_codon:yes stop_codon:yes gene_type:complete